MNVNYYTLVSLLTRSNYVPEKDWGKLMDAEEYILNDVIAAWEVDHDITEPYDIYGDECTELIKNYLLTTYPEFEELIGLLDTETDYNKRKALVDKMKDNFSDNYSLSIIPSDYKVEKEKTQ